MSQSFPGHVEMDEYDHKYMKSQKKKKELAKKIGKKTKLANELHAHGQSLMEDRKYGRGYYKD